jgi:hypothetical protein
VQSFTRESFFRDGDVVAKPPWTAIPRVGFNSISFTRSMQKKAVSDAKVFQ